MNVLVVYESMYGNTHHVANAIAAGLRDVATVAVVPVGDATADRLAQADLLVVGGPTHVHGMSRPSTRKAAADALAKSDDDLELDPDAAGPGLREWLTSLDVSGHKCAAFDTRMHGPAALTGRASKGIARQLEKHGGELVTEPHSFVVTKHNELEPGELARATTWGLGLATCMVPDVDRRARST